MRIFGQGSELNGQNKPDFSENEQQAPVLALDPFDEYVLRFNYTEVSDLNSYAEALALELREEPLETTIWYFTFSVHVLPVRLVRRKRRGIV